MSNDKEYAVKLRLFKGKKSYNQDGSVQSTNQTIDLSPFNSFSWNNFMKNAPNIGYTAADVLEVHEIVYTTTKNKKDEDVITTTYKLVETPQMIVDDVKKAFNPIKEVKLTPEQQELADLKEEMAEMKAAMKGGKKPSAPKPTAAPVDNTPDVNEELEVARAKYTKVFGKKPHHMMQLPKMNELIAEKAK